MSFKPKAYLLPDELEPSGYRCFKMYVPDEPEYIAAFWGSIDFLATWTAWERDADKNARVAARVWKDAVEISRFSWLAGDCDVSNLDFREKPGKPWVMQVTTDGEHWHDALDTCACTDLPDNTNDQKTQVIEQIVRYWLQPLMKTIVDAVGAGRTREQWLDQWKQDNPGVYLSPAVQGAMNRIWDTTTPTAGNPSDWLSDCKYTTIANSWLDKIKTHCETADSIWQCMDKALGDVQSHLDNVTDVAFTQILTSMGVQTLWSDAIRRGECVGNECDEHFMACNSWMHTFDFTGGDTHDWTSLAFPQAGPNHPAQNGYFGATEATIGAGGWHHPVNPNIFYDTEPTFVTSDMFVQLQSPYLYGAVIGGVGAEIVVNTPVSTLVTGSLAMMKSYFPYSMVAPDFHSIAPGIFLYANNAFFVYDGIPNFPTTTHVTDPLHNLIVGFWVDNTFGDKLPDLTIKSITLSGTGIDPFYGMEG